MGFLTPEPLDQDKRGQGQLGFRPTRSGCGQWGLGLQTHWWRNGLGSVGSDVAAEEKPRKTPSRTQYEPRLILTREETPN